MLDKFSEETWSDLKLAVAWCVSAKTSLSNIYGFSPFQLAISTNPKLISMIRIERRHSLKQLQVISNKLKTIQSKGSIHCQ